MRRARQSLIVGVLGFLCAAGLVAAGRDDSAARLRDNGSGADWAGYGATFGEQHFSPLTEINADTVDRLKLAWWIDLPPGNSVSQPLAVDGILYFVTRHAVVHAADAATGRVLWEYDPKVPEVAGRKLRYAWGTRGIAWWNGKIYVGTFDGRLIALDARTGKPVWSAMTVSPDDTRYISGAPRVFDGKVIVGFGNDFGKGRAYVTTYDAETGKLLWRWYVVPGNPARGFENKAMEMAAKTWSGEWWKYDGGGSVWNAISYDPETSTVFLGTGNGSPWNHRARSQGKGDNLFLASIVALDGKTGAYKWHYQVNPGETWDYTATQDIAFADIELRGQRRKVLMTAPKNGFFYVIDRISGELLSAEPIAKVTWATRVDLKTGRPVEDPAMRYPNGTTAIVWPSARGAHNWQPMAFSRDTRFAYIPVIEKAQSWADADLAKDRWRKDEPVGTVQMAARTDLYPKVDDALDGTSKLLAWDVVRQKPAWSRPTPGPMAGGIMATGGNLVFQGQLDGRFNAWSADQGKLLWSFQAGAPVIAAPITYSVKGRQHVTVLTGAGTSSGFLGPPLAQFAIDYRTQARRVLTFVLDGMATLPPPSPVRKQPIEDPQYMADEARAGRGAALFGNCALCHGAYAVASGPGPDLRASPIVLSADAFADVVQKGALVPAGMPRFSELGDEDVAAIRQYLRARAAEWRNGK